MSRGRIVLGGVLVLVLVGVAGLGVRQWRASTARSERCDEIQALNTERGNDPVGDGLLRIAVLGDSYAQGQGLSDPRSSWPAELAAQTDSTVWVYAVGGSGFSQSSYCDGATYAERARDVLAEGPDIVIAQGGLNDTVSDDDEIVFGLQSTLAELDSVRVVVVGPPLAPQRDGEDVRRVDADLSRATTDAGVQYISALDWSLTYGPDALHPDEEGQRRFGYLVSGSLG